MRPVSDDKLEHMLFVWNGKQTDHIVMAQAVEKALELERFIINSRGPFLEVLFSGGVFQDNTLRTGSILQLISNRRREYKNQELFTMVREKVFLFKILFPKKVAFPSDQEQMLPDPFIGHDEDYSQWENSRSNRPISERVRNEVGSIDSQGGQMSERGRITQNPQSYTYEGRDINGFERLELRINVSEGRYAQQQSVSDQDGSQNEPTSLSGSRGGRGDGDAESPARRIDNPPNNRPEVPITRLAIPTLGVQNLNLNSHSNQQGGGGNTALPTLNLGGLARAPIGNYNYQDLNDEEHSDQVNYDIRETERRQVKMDRFKNECSEILPNFLYLGGYVIAEDRHMLESNGITHILNCAGDYCKNRFMDELSYKTYFLKDSKLESIEAVFYQCIEHLDEIKSSGGRVLVHCVQGISRSATIVLAYLIFKEGMKYDIAYNMVREKRGIASPNLGFVVQLMTFYQRLYEAYSKLLIQPKVFAVSNHQLEDPTTIVARLLSDEPLYTGKSCLKLDPRGVFIVANDKQSFIWVGKDVFSACHDIYLNFAQEYIEKLVKYEKLPDHPKLVKQDQEPAEFWSVFNFTNPPPEKYGNNRFWDNWFLNLGDLKSITSRSDRSRLEYAEKEELDERPAAFLYPNFVEPLYVMELEDLFEDSFLIICNKENKKVLVWRGAEFSEEAIPLQEFMNGAIQNFYKQNSFEGIEFVEERPHEESEEFLRFF